VTGVPMFRSKGQMSGLEFGLDTDDLTQICLILIKNYWKHLKIPAIQTKD